MEQRTGKKVLCLTPRQHGPTVQRTSLGIDLDDKEELVRAKLIISVVETWPAKMFEAIDHNE